MGETAGRLADLSVLTEDNSRDEDVMDIINDIIEGGLKKTNGKYVVVPKGRMLFVTVWKMQKMVTLLFLQVKDMKIT